MVGNDIIDLQAAKGQKEPTRDRFLNKVFSYKEQEIIRRSKNPEVQVWMLWAMKEAAYKAHQRRFKLPRTFDPKKLKCEIWEQHSGSAIGGIFIGRFLYQSQLLINPEYIFCTASTLKSDNICSTVFSALKCSKQELIFKYSALHNIPDMEVKIVKDLHQVPHISINKNIKNHPFSLSHHGKFSAYSLALMNY